MNRSIRFGAIFSLILVLGLLVNITIIQAFKEDEYAQNPLNARTYYQAQKVPRGMITAGGQVIAESFLTEEGSYQRTYPLNPEAFGSLVGYMSAKYGAGGLELGYNGLLSGTDDRLSAARTFNIFRSEDHGANVDLTVDPNLQVTAYNLLAQNNYEGAIVALRPSSGAVLAMASSPSYSANPLVDPATEDETWEQLNADPMTPLIDRASQDTLPPGSIFKIITTAAALRNGYTPESAVTGAASITLPNTTTELTNYGDQACNGQEEVSLETAFAFSCNTAFVDIATRLGSEPLRQAAADFGVGESYDLDQPTASGNLGDLPDLAAVGQSAIGQRDVTMSALQAAIMAGTVANGGKRMEPYLVNSVTDADLKQIESASPSLAADALSSQDAQTITKLMIASEHNTSGYNGNGYASKTGTAEHGEGMAPHTWYVAFDPAKDVAVAVVVKDGGGWGQSATGGQVSAPLGRAVLQAATGGEQ